MLRVEHPSRMVTGCRSMRLRVTMTLDLDLDELESRPRRSRSSAATISRPRLGWTERTRSSPVWRSPSRRPASSSSPDSSAPCPASCRPTSRPGPVVRDTRPGPRPHAVMGSGPHPRTCRAARHRWLTRCAVVRESATSLSVCQLQNHTCVEVLWPTLNGFRSRPRGSSPD